MPTWLNLKILYYFILICQKKSVILVVMLLKHSSKLLNSLLKFYLYKYSIELADILVLNKKEVKDNPSPQTLEVWGGRAKTNKLYY